MATLDEAECVRRVLLSEGGYVNDPRDPGGPTNMGITLRDARLHWKADATAEDVRNMPRSVAVSIFQSKYWAALRCDELPAGVDYTVLDYGVHSGIARSAHVLRRVLGLPLGDGRVSDEVIETLRHVNPVHVVDAINDERMAFLRHLPTWGTYGRGWTPRVASVRSYSEHLASEGHPTLAPSAHYCGPDLAGKAYGGDDPHPGARCVLEPDKPKNEPQSESVVRQNEQPATQVPPTSPEAPKPPSMLKSKTGWAAVFLGSSGAADLLDKANDIASKLSIAKFNLSELHAADVAVWLFHHPSVLLPFAMVACAAFVWADHRKYKRLLAAAQGTQ